MRRTVGTGEEMTEKVTVRELHGANLDIDLITQRDTINWKQDSCPWNIEENSKEHKCAVKNSSICKYFKGIKSKDTVLCSYPEGKGRPEIRK